MSLSNIIKSIQDIMRKDAGVAGDARRISQLVWLIFLKIFDDKEQENELTAWCDELEVLLQTQSDTAADFARAVANML